MNIPEAIEILTEFMETTHEVDAYNFDDGVQLGIEALKACLKHRQGETLPEMFLLPGETKK